MSKNNVTKKIEDIEHMSKANSSYGSIESTDNCIEFSKRDYISLAIIYLCVFVSDAARGILFPTLWLYVQSFGVGSMYQGFVVSAFSAGRIISSPILGYFSEIYGYRKSLVLSNLIVIIGCFLYGIAPNVMWLIIGQFIIGIGAGR
jgi:MFS family permease